MNACVWQNYGCACTVQVATMTSRVQSDWNRQTARTSVSVLQSLCLLYIITKNFVSRKWMQVVSSLCQRAVAWEALIHLLTVCLTTHMPSVFHVFFVSHLLLCLGNINVLLYHYSIIGVLNVLLYRIIYKLSFQVPFLSYFLPFGLSYPGT